MGLMQFWVCSTMQNMEEFEITFFEVNVKELEVKLLEVGAEKVGEYHFRRALFDYPDMRMNAKNSWLRLRTDGQKVTLAYKSKTGDDVKEIEVIVEDYEKTYTLLKSMGLVVKREEENKRIKYQKGNTTFDIDSWPQIPVYLEIESTSIQEARNSAGEVGLDPKDGVITSPLDGYKKYGIDLNEYSVITFEKMIKKCN